MLYEVITPRKRPAEVEMLLVRDLLRVPHWLGDEPGFLALLPYLFFRLVRRPLLELGVDGGLRIGPHPVRVGRVLLGQVRLADELAKRREVLVLVRRDEAVSGSYNFV